MWFPRQPPGAESSNYWRFAHHREKKWRIAEKPWMKKSSVAGLNFKHAGLANNWATSGRQTGPALVTGSRWWSGLLPPPRQPLAVSLPARQPGRWPDVPERCIGEIAQFADQWRTVSSMGRGLIWDIGLVPASSSSRRSAVAQGGQVLPALASWPPGPFLQARQT